MNPTQPSEPSPMQVDFGYAFTTPHRLTVALPDSSNKTLVDVQPGKLRMAWTYDSLTNKPPATFVIPKTEWEVQLTADVDGKAVTTSQWSRAEGWLPALVNTFNAEPLSLRLDVAGAATAAIIRVTVENPDLQPHRLVLSVEKPGKWTGFNPAWIQPEWDNDVLLAGWLERTDRILVFALGADEKPVPSSTTLCLAWNLAPGEKRVGWIIRPYQAYHSILPVLRQQDWAAEFDAALAVWRLLISRAARLSIPDAAVQNAFYAALADCFIMREPVAGGYLAVTPGTEQYRANNPVETGIVSVLMDQVGLHSEAASSYQMNLDLQDTDGCWAYTPGWEHYMWGVSGFKAWTAMEHYRLSGSRDYLANVYPRLAASSRWQERQRARTRTLVNGERPLTFGLLPRGMGDGGLLGEDGSYYGIFFTHNIMAVYADMLALEAAEILGLSADLPELQRICSSGREDLLQALERGAISEDDYRWIPGVPGLTLGSRWGALYAAYPSRILPRDHELITGTIRKMEQRISPGGIPIHTGWMLDGMWVAITLDNLAEVLLLRNEGDAAVRYLYATLNHGTPLYSWCEERGQEPGAKEITGDLQHLWTPVAVGRFIRDALLMEDGDTLHLGRGAARQWFGNEQPLGIQGGATHFGRVSYTLQYDPFSGHVSGTIEVTPGPTLKKVVLHVRLPGGLKVISLQHTPGGVISTDGSTIEWTGSINAKTTFKALVG